MKFLLRTNRWAISVAALLLCLVEGPEAKAQTVVRQGETTTFTVTEIPGDTYVWELYSDSTVDFAITDGDPSPAAYAEFTGPNDQPAVNVLWKEPGTYFVKVTALDAAGCTNNLKVIIVRVLHPLPTAVITAGPAVCVGEDITLTVALTGTGPWDFTYTDGVTEWTVNVPDISETPPEIVHILTINPGPIMTTQYWITSVTDRYGTNAVPSERTTQQVNPLPTPSAIYHN
jgi:hypothetical protein